MPTRLLLFTLLSLGAVLAVVAPLATYAVTLAAFGLPHVVTELRYVDQRYARRAPRRVLAAWGLLLTAVVIGRVLVFIGVVDKFAEIGVELLVIAALAYTTWGLPTARPALGRITAATVASALVIGATLAPATTMVSLAVLHNLTPLGFFADALNPRDLALAVAGLIGVPLVLATGLPAEWLAFAAGSGAAWDPLHMGPLTAHLGAYLPGALQGRSFTDDLFRAAVYGQWAHYVAVIGVLPALARPEDAAGALAPWPRGPLFLGAVVALTIPLFGAFATDFVTARSAYGFVAAVHAWVEVPVLLWVIGGPTAAGPVARRS